SSLSPRGSRRVPGAVAADGRRGRGAARAHRRRRRGCPRARAREPRAGRLHGARGGERRGGRRGGRGAVAGPDPLRRHAVRRAGARRPQQAAAPRLTSWDRHLERWVVAHRVGVLDPVFVGLSYAGTFGAVWLVLGAALAVARRRPEPFLWTLAAYVA